VENPTYQIKVTGKQTINRGSFKNEDLDLPDEDDQSPAKGGPAGVYKDVQPRYASGALAQQPVKSDGPRKNLLQKVGPNAGLPGSFSPTKAVDSATRQLDQKRFSLEDSGQREIEVNHVIQVDRVNHRRASLPDIGAPGVGSPHKELAIRSTL
jgi:hypothetical protein